MEACMLMLFGGQAKLGKFCYKLKCPCPPLRGGRGRESIKGDSSMGRLPKSYLHSNFLDDDK